VSLGRLDELCNAMRGDGSEASVRKGGKKDERKAHFGVFDEERKETTL
jgi:hypothetical protein